MAQRSRLMMVLVASSLAACGGKAFELDHTDPGVGGGAGQGGSSHVAGGGTEAGGTEAGGTDTGGTGVGGTDTGGTGVGGGEGGNGGACPSLVDDPATFIGVDIVNETAAPIYLGQPMVNCEVSPLFSVNDARGGSLPSPSRCRSACGSESGGCTAICLFPAGVELLPGASVRTSWDGLFDVQIDLPPECSSTGGSTHCQHATRIQPGTFVFSAQAGSTLDCSETSMMCGQCTPDELGNCVTQGALIAGKLRTATATVELDSSYGVYTKTLPPPGPSGDSDAARALLRVRIVFED
jgi:hypothetical protein